MLKLTHPHETLRLGLFLDVVSLCGDGQGCAEPFQNVQRGSCGMQMALPDELFCPHECRNVLATLQFEHPTVFVVTPSPLDPAHS